MQHNFLLIQNKLDKPKQQIKNKITSQQYTDQITMNEISVKDAYDTLKQMRIGLN